jgi:hypothetical protein
LTTTSPNEKVDAHLLLSLISSEKLSSFDSQISILTSALALPCTLKGFLRCLNGQEYSKRGGGVVFIHPSKKTNRYFLTRGHRTRRCNAPDAPVPRNGRIAILKTNHRTRWCNTPDASDVQGCLLDLHRTRGRVRCLKTGRVRSSLDLTGLAPDSPMKSRPRPTGVLPE